MFGHLEIRGGRPGQIHHRPWGEEEGWSVIWSLRGNGVNGVRQFGDSIYSTYSVRVISQLGLQCDII